MAETRSITITIRQAKGVAPTPETPRPEGSREVEKRAVSMNGPTVAASVLFNQLYQAGKQAVVSEARYQVERYFDVNDDYVGKRNLEEAMSALGASFSFASAAVAGATAMSGAGPLGMAAGATVGLIATGIGKAVDISQRLDAQRLEIEKADAQLAFSRQRAGWSLTAGSIGEGL